MGHASIAVTAPTYASLFDDELANIAAALDSLDEVGPFEKMRSSTTEHKWPMSLPIEFE
jgi:hypothetical protein